MPRRDAPAGLAGPFGPAGPIGLAGSAITGLALIGAGHEARADQPAPWALGMQDAATPISVQMHNFHSLLLVIITAIVVLVMALLAFVMWRFRASRNPTPSRTTHNTLLEVAWTAVPVLILLVIAIPSFRLLYFTDRVEDPELTVIATGYQWYWGYALPDQQIRPYNSSMLRGELGEGQLRLLSVDNPLVLPVDTTVEVLVRGFDVLHSFAVPSFGVKTDAVPGRTNHAWIRIAEEGTYYGQCSEICGVNHGFMPIEIRAVSREDFDDWVLEKTAGLDLETPPVLLTRRWEDAVAARRLAALAGTGNTSSGETTTE